MKRIKTILAAVLALALFAGLTAPLATQAADDNIVITIFHTNDMHGRFVRGDAANAHAETIGMQYITSIVNATPNAILLDAGDTFHGTPFTVFSEGLDPVRLMNAAGYLFMAPGNHDFNFGMDQLLTLEEAADFGILAANVFWEQDGRLAFTPYAVREIYGITFGFFGLATPDTPLVTHPNNVRGLYFGCPTEAAAQMVTALQAHNVDIIVGITHIGTGPINQVAAAVNGIDLIVDGHSHSEHPAGHWENDTLIVQARDHGRRLGEVTLTFSANGTLLNREARLLTFADDIDGNFTACAEMMALIAVIGAEFYEQTRVVVAYTPVTLEHTHTLIRSYEMPIGNLVADSFRWASDADIALMNGGAIRDVIEAGDITVGDMLRVLPFINYLVIVEMTPAVIFEALENGVSRWPTESGNGRFLQVAGLSYVFDAFAPVGERILSVAVNGVALNRNDTSTVFEVAITDFKANGGDGFDMFTDLPIVYEGDVKSTVFIDFLTSGDANVAGASVEGRILQVGTEPLDLPEPTEPTAEAIISITLQRNALAANGTPMVVESGGQTWLSLRGLTEVLGGSANSVRNADGGRTATFTFGGGFEPITISDCATCINNLQVQTGQVNASGVHFQNIRGGWYITQSFFITLFDLTPAIV